MCSLARITGGTGGIFCLFPWLVWLTWWLVGGLVTAQSHITGKVTNVFFFRSVCGAFAKRRLSGAGRPRARHGPFSLADLGLMTLRAYVGWGVSAREVIRGGGPAISGRQVLGALFP